MDSQATLKRERPLAYHGRPAESQIAAMMHASRLWAACLRCCAQQADVKVTDRYCDTANLMWGGSEQDFGVYRL